MLLAIGLLLAVAGSVTSVFLLRAFGGEGAGGAGWVVLVPPALALVGLALVVVAVLGLLREGRRRAMPLAAQRPAPAPATSARWELADVASEVARRLQGSPCSVHQEGERLEVRWAGEPLGQHRCELRDGGDGMLVHADVIESPFEVRRLHNGIVTWAGPSRHGLGAPGSGAFRTLDRSGVHDAVDEALALAGWSRRG
ncbi:hypothetical protein [Agrococcus beijingensis]|uniref:hypothetical protein n=1 Tax=Agrococcus beijingensis TaxID=3068634 RepID=UPI002740E1EA|nr:hypothetical protein [Agrococcus sp. REN33]